MDGESNTAVVFKEVDVTEGIHEGMTLGELHWSIADLIRKYGTDSTVVFDSCNCQVNVYLKPQKNGERI